ncbi:MAG: SRPBCC family protein [Acidimicrobiales bacterium]
MDYEATVSTSASLQELWRVLVDVERWPSLTPSMRAVRRLDTGDLEVGSQARISQPGMLPATWEVTELIEGTSFRWQSSAPGVVSTGDHIVGPSGAGAELTLRIHQEGPLAGIVGLAYGRRVRRFLDQEANGLRRAAERSPGTGSALPE